MVDTFAQVDEFLRLRRNISSTLSLLEKYDEQLLGVIQVDSGRGVKILHALSGSDTKDERDFAAVYVGYLFPARHEQAKEIISRLLNDSDEDIRITAEDTLDAVVGRGHITPMEAARLLASEA